MEVSRPPRRLAVIYNPTAGGSKRRRLEQTLSLLRDADCTLELRETERAGHAKELAQAIDPSEAEVIVAAGGDGTINEVINGMITGSPQGAALPLAILPLGTANVLAMEIGVGLNPNRIAGTILRGAARPVVLGEANGRLFTVMAGVGFDAQVVAGVDLALKRRIGKGAYLWESARQLRRFAFPTYRVRIDGAAQEAASVIVAKGRYYAGKFLCAPDARIDQPLFQVCLFRRPGPRNVLRYALALGAGLLPRLADYQMIPGREVVIEGPEGDPVQGDGDLIARLPLTVGLRADALRIVMPEAVTPS